MTFVPSAGATVDPLGYADIRSAAERIRGRVRPVAVAPMEDGPPSRAQGAGRTWLALEYMQHTGSFKARGAVNFLLAHGREGALPEAGVTIASGGNAGLACAWAAAALQVRATVFLPASAPAVKVARLRAYGAEVRLVEGEYADAASACAGFARESGALTSHAYDDPHVAAGAGTLLDEIRDQVPELDTVLVAVGGGGLFAGVATAARHHGIRAVAVEPEGCRALHAALEAGDVVDVPVDGVAADALGARRATRLALHAARRGDTRSVLVRDRDIVRARRTLWEERRIVTEPGGATALAALLSPGDGGYAPHPDENIAIVLCGANTDPATLVAED
ncbi:threonine/serine dehydratase [Actinomadura kijaniata]|uniref:Threonine dehydratase n=1 Tax=Actinomadura namibiensis TaxID=182080 RepID=A0A7W3LYY8_ACTNM|nr:serine/threonine dehydratase [Actinomadura namibiensis]MBA8956822.1 threonine dehydratase [Actinomadura namibiensis]